MGDASDFEEWSGIVRDYPEEDENVDADTDHGTRTPTAVAASVSSVERAEGRLDEHSSILALRLRRESFLTSERTVDWSLSNEDGAQAMRVSVGRGSVTVVNASSFRATRHLRRRPRLALRRGDAVATWRRCPFPVGGRTAVAPGAGLDLRTSGRRSGVCTHRAGVVARRRAFRSTRGTAADRPALARRADSRDRSVRDSTQRRRGVCTRRPFARSTKRPQRRVSGYAEPVGHGNAPKHWPISPASTATPWRRLSTIPGCAGHTSCAAR